MDENDNTVTLAKPIEGTDKKKIEKITLRKPSPGELRGVQLGMLGAGEVSMLTKVISRISTPHLTEAQVSGMDLGDFTECYVKIQGFLGN